MSTHEDSPFYDIGYTTPDEAEEFHSARLEAQKIDKVTRSQQQRNLGKAAFRRTAVRDYESDRDYIDEMAALPPDFEEEPYEGEPIDNPRAVAHIIARRAKTRHMAEQLGANSAEYRIWLAEYNKNHPLPGI
jgi:hypothetical protein